MFVETWLSEMLGRRADQSWTPQLFAHPNIAARLKTLCGYPVEKDPQLPDCVLEVRRDGEMAARYEGNCVKPAKNA